MALALAAALARLAQFDWLIVTSANGARAVGAAAGEVPGVRLAAVGPATAAVLAESAGRPVDLVPVVARAEGLLEELPQGPAHVLLAQADQARPVLAAGLVAAGHDVEVVVAYRTVERPPSDAETVELAAADAVVLASGSAARTYAAAVGTRAGAASPGRGVHRPRHGRGRPSRRRRGRPRRRPPRPHHPHHPAHHRPRRPVIGSQAFSGVTSDPGPPGESASA